MSSFSFSKSFCGFCTLTLLGVTVFWSTLFAFAQAPVPDENGFVTNDPTDIERPLTELEKADISFCEEKYVDNVMVGVANAPDSVTAGDTLTLQGTILNNNTYPVVDAVFKAKVIQIIAPTSELPVEWYALVEEMTIVDSVTLREGAEGSFLFPWTVPNVPEGQYRIVFFVTTKEGKDISGISSSYQIGAGANDFIVYNSGVVTVSPTTTPYIPSTATHWSKSPSVASYPIVKDEENSFFTCIGFDVSTTTTHKAILTLKDAQGTIIKETSHTQNPTESTLKALVARFTPENEYTSFTLTLDVYANDALVEHTEVVYRCENLGTCTPPPLQETTLPERSPMAFTDILQIIFLSISIFAILTALYKYVKEKQHMKIPTLLILGLYLASGLVYMTVMSTANTNAALATKYTPSTHSPYGLVSGFCPNTNPIFSYTYSEQCTPFWSESGVSYSCPTLGSLSTLPSDCITTYTEYGPMYECPVTITQLNGRTTNLGVHNRCVLTGVRGDWEDIRSCFLSGTVDGNWSVRATDEGDSVAFICDTLCSNKNTAGVAYGYGATCKVGTKYGVMNNASQCCTGTYYDAGCPYPAVSHDLSCATPNAPQVTSFTGTNGTQSGSSLTNIPNGSTVTLDWSVSDVTQCIASGAPDWTGEVSMTGGNQTVTVSADTTYTLTCSGYTGEEVTQHVTVLTSAPSIIDFTVTPNPVPYGDSAVISWSSINTTSCTAGGDWFGTKSTSGNESTGPVTAPKTYTLYCEGPLGTSNTITITLQVACAAQDINGCRLPLTSSGDSAGMCISGYSGGCNYTCTNGVWTENSNTCGAPLITEFKVCDVGEVNCVSSGNKDVIVNSPFEIHWDSTNAEFCSEVSGPDFSTGNAVSGIDTATAGAVPGVTNTYAVACGNGGTIGVTSSVDVTTLEAIPVITATPRVVEEGDEVALSWDTRGSDPSSCRIVGGGLNMTSLGTNTGTVDVIVNARTTFVIICGSGGTGRATVEVIPRGFES